ncbi:hypothetical protein CEXT_141311 [Caerostris extrusa]|uniref:Uncharacterized protein n=1 Tax=Caerostris extrusa TaxID=172846 RepID=A0AAV4WBE4_CAEEX|nr:hypothetical protein CEXT_141311 [Caerostris extrusa]
MPETLGSSYYARGAPKSRNSEGRVLMGRSLRSLLGRSVPLGFADSPFEMDDTGARIVYRRREYEFLVNAATDIKDENTNFVNAMARKRGEYEFPRNAATDTKKEH